MKFIQHLNGKTWEAVIDAKWWPNQKRAVAKVSDYLDAKTDQQAMVRMPTGTGKTVVIATFSQLLEDYPRALIVAPWEHLVGQLEREISSRLWAKLGEATSPRWRLFDPSLCSRRHRSPPILLSHFPHQHAGCFADFLIQ